MIVLAYASTVVPVWLLARAAGAERAWAALAALGAVLVPWAGLTGTFLTEGLAYPLVGWACLAIFATVANPSPRADLVALAAIGASMLARTGLVLLLFALAVAVLGQELRLAASEREPPPRSAAAGAAARGPRCRRSRSACCCSRSAVPTGSPAPGMRTPAPAGRTPGTALTYVISSVAAGVGFVPVLAALGFGLTQIVRPRSPRDLALAWLVVGVLATFTVTLISGPVEERYVFYWALPCAVALAVAASRRAASIPAIAAATVLVLVAMGDRVWRTEIESFWGFQLFPAESFQARVVRLGVSDRLPGSLSVDGRVVSAVVVLLAAIVTALIASPVPRAVTARAGTRARTAGAAPWLRRTALALGCVVVFAGTLQAAWGMHKFVKAGGGGRSLRGTYDDRAPRRRASGRALASAGSRVLGEPDLAGARYYNPHARGLYRLGAAQDAPLLIGEVAAPVVADPASGRISPANPGDRVPALLVAIPGQRTAPLRGKVVGRDRGLGVDLIRPSTPTSVRWVSGPSLDGTIDARSPQTIRVFPPYPRRACLEVDATLLSPRRGDFVVSSRPGSASVWHARRARNASCGPLSVAALPRTFASLCSRLEASAAKR